MKITTFAVRLRELLNTLAITQTELSKNTGVSTSSISHYLKGDWEAKQDVIYAIATRYDVAEAWLMGHDVPMKKTTPNVFSYSGVLPLPKAKKIPVLGTIACGDPILAEENYEDFAFVDENIHADFALRCQGDSMIEARIHENDYVFIRHQPNVENGEIAAVLINNEATLKRVYRYPNKLVLQPANKNYEPLVYTDNELNEIRIIGKAVYFLSRVE